MVPQFFSYIEASVLLLEETRVPEKNTDLLQVTDTLQPSKVHLVE
jgi:hypothetical protein